VKTVSGNRVPPLCPALFFRSEMYYTVSPLVCQQFLQEFLQNNAQPLKSCLTLGCASLPYKAPQSVRILHTATKTQKNHKIGNFFQKGLFFLVRECYTILNCFAIIASKTKHNVKRFVCISRKRRLSPHFLCFSRWNAGNAKIE